MIGPRAARASRTPIVALGRPAAEPSGSRKGPSGPHAGALCARRRSGVLLHPTSLPGPYGIGDIGPRAHRWIDFLADAGCTLWQILPLGPTGEGNSPYQSFSAFAGNTLLISPEALLADGLLRPEDLEMAVFPEERVDYDPVRIWKRRVIERAVARYRKSPPLDLAESFEEFRQTESHWLEDYALFTALRRAHKGRSWVRWPVPERDRRPAAMRRARAELAETIATIEFRQFLFFRQWEALRAHARSRGVLIVGDLPIFVAHDSADVWARRRLFDLDGEGNAAVVAGVPPDYFSETGQLWGNPLYRWDAHARERYAWWTARMRAILGMVDVVRLDHFRGFAGCWTVPAGEETAERGQWVAGPGALFFESLHKTLGPLPIIAEDLGEITPDVIELRERFEVPGMKVLQFAFSGPENLFLPHHYSWNCVVYTGTHDNDTVRGWYASTSEPVRDFCRRYLARSGHDIAWDLLRAAWASSAGFAVAPMQDVLDLGSEARMNLPGTKTGNWTWRMGEWGMRADIQKGLRELNTLFARIPPPAGPPSDSDPA